MILSGNALLVRIGNRAASITTGLALPVYVDGMVIMLTSFGTVLTVIDVQR
jgi:hypothetical protein